MAFSAGGSDNEFSEINITPLTDVFLILFLIMIVIAPMIRETALSVDPPKAKNGQTTSSQAKVINLEINEEGLIAINGKKLQDKALLPEEVEPMVTKRLQEILADESYKDSPLNIVADEETRQKFVVGAMDAAAGLGLKKMNIVTVSGL